MERKSLRGSIVLRLLVIGLLVLLLLIPSGMISGLVHERQQRKAEVVGEVTGKWAKEQVIAGPVVTIPYNHAWKDDKGVTRVETRFLQFLPRNLEVEAKIDPTIKHRAIYKVILYNLTADFKGDFVLDRLAGLGVAAADVRWGEAFVSVGIPDMRGIKEAIVMNWEGREHLFEPGIRDGNELFHSGVSARIPLDRAAMDGRPREFAFHLNLNGSGKLMLLPLGRTTEVRMRSPWVNPSFDGAFLPTKSEIGQDGFSASWKVLDLNRNYPQEWSGRAPDIFDSAFGVKLFSPVDEYTMTTRAVKYTVMFVGLTFLLFFLVEVFNRRRIHPIQYLLVGLALCLFYLLLLSLSEHLGFGWAYLIAALATTILIAFYVRGALGKGAPGIATALSLAGLYGFLYVLLQNQDYALVIGSVGLFAIMAAIMFLSRHVDWYGLEAREEQPAQTAQ